MQVLPIDTRNAILKCQLTADGTFYEKDTGNHFCYWDGAPDEWAGQRGATHTVRLTYRDLPHQSPLRGAKILKTVLYLAVDESPEGDIVWEKWDIRRHVRVTK
jgi:hypothetical protein